LGGVTVVAESDDRPTGNERLERTVWVDREGLECLDPRKRCREVSWVCVLLRVPGYDQRGAEHLPRVIDQRDLAAELGSGEIRPLARWL
jgi:hypothetical protein